ncbi:hypothetical protein D4Q76_01870 [archaeon]|nr:MAG: hypothetical protein D4Q76_01870 [archaeon]
MKVVYVCCPKNIEAIETLSKVMGLDTLPLVPHLVFSGFERKFGKKYADMCRLKLIEKCEEVWLLTSFTSEEMKEDLEHAKKNSIPIVNKWQEIIRHEEEKLKLKL